MRVNSGLSICRAYTTVEFVAGQWSWFTTVNRPLHPFRITGNVCIHTRFVATTRPATCYVSMAGKQLWIEQASCWATRPLNTRSLASAFQCSTLQRAPNGSKRLCNNCSKFVRFTSRKWTFLVRLLFNFIRRCRSDSRKDIKQTANKEKPNKDTTITELPVFLAEECRDCSDSY